MGKPKASFPGYDDAASDEQIMGMKMSALFILEKDLHKGKSVNLHISKDAETPPSVPRQVADSLPFTSNNIQDIYKAFKVNPASLEASLIEKTCNKCKKAYSKKQDHYCANSLESMVDYASSKLGKRVKAVSTQVDGNESAAALQGYKVEGVRKLNGDNAVVCHQEYYGYAVHYCHKASKINAYMVSLVGENNVKAKAISVCHEDTSSWNPKHLAFQVLNVKPGTYAVCHFLVENEVAWVPY